MQHAMRKMLGWWKNVSIIKRLYLVVGVMAVLIAGELITLRFAMQNLSAVRAFVGGESLWSKAQKDAVFSLQRFGVTGNEADFTAFLNYLKIPEGDHQARLELLKAQPDIGLVKAGFIQGGIHPDDIMPMYKLLRRFYWITYLSRAIQVWSDGDDHLVRLKALGGEYHHAVISKQLTRASDIMENIKGLNEELTGIEQEFSYVLGQGSRWLEHFVLTALFLAVMTVETIGLTITIMTSRSLSKGLRDLNGAALAIGGGDFTKRVQVHSTDEIGTLGTSVNQMGGMLQKSYAELEKRVKERTEELSLMVIENKRLYEEAKSAVQMRDEFLSVASHELKTPVTALSLQLELLRRHGEVTSDPFVKDTTAKALLTMKRTTRLIDELLDLTRIKLGRFEIRQQPCDLVAIVREIATQFAPEAAKKGSAILVHSNGDVLGTFDPTRMGQVITNLISNAIKYGNGQPISVFVGYQDGRAVLKVRDNGHGIPPTELERIFERFERAESDPNISGLGLGLYITRQIVQAHGGRITVVSEVDHGSEFIVTI